MKQLKQTVRVKNGHQHIAYLNDEIRQGIISVTKNHSHIVTLEPIYSETIGMEDGMEDGMMAKSVYPMPPQIIGFNWNVQPADKDNHTHELIDYISKEPKLKEEDIQIVKDIQSLNTESKEIEFDARKKGKESEEFYRNEQWIPSQKRKLESENRAVLTINEIEPKVDLLCGYQRQNRTDFKCFPTEEGDQKIAEICNIVLKNITEQCNYANEETEVFEDQVVPGRGCYNVYVSYEKNILGDIIVERFPWEDIRFGPHEKKDASDAEYLIKEKWFSLSKIKQLWPDKADKLQPTAIELDETKEHEQNKGQGYTGESKPISASAGSDSVEIQKKDFKVLECWRKEYRRNYAIVNATDDFYFNAEGWAKQDIETVKTIPGFSVIPRDNFKMRVTTIANEILLNDDYPDLPLQEFHCIPVYAKKRGKHWWGKVESVKDANREINKRHSQIIDITNKTIAYGWFYDDNTFENPQEAEAFIKKASSPGFTQKVMNAEKPPPPSEQVKFPTELVNLMAIDSLKIKELMNVNLELSGQARASQSGMAIMQQKQQGLIGNEFLFDNLSFSKKRVGKLILAYVQKIYTSDRILRIIENQNQKQEVQIAGQPYNKYDPKEIMELLQNADLTQYDINVSESPYSPSIRLANFMMWSDLAGKGIPVPPQLLVDLSDLPDKEKVLQNITAMQQQKMQAEQGKQNMEIQKTLIAAQSKQQGG